MTVAVSCPAPRQLQQLLLGQLDDDSSEGLEQHVLTCGTCSAALPTLPAEDGLVAAMRSRRAAAIPADEQPLVEELERRLCERPAAGDSIMDPSHGEAGPAASDPLNFDFLAPAQAPDELGRLGAYRVLKVLGRGGMGIVFLAEDTQLQRTVALKVMLPQVALKATARDRFVLEARAAAAIEHDHIVAIHQVGEERGVPFLVMPLLQGESLEDWLQRREQERPGQPARVAETLRLGREIALGLAAAHAHGLIHRDVKPGNIWLDAQSSPLSPCGRGVGGEGRRVKLLDFGLARPAQDENHLTGSGVIVGTPAYMAPEQARGGLIDSAADLWSLGCVLYRLCTGRLPFQGPDLMATLLASATEPPTAPRDLNPEVPPVLNDLILRLLAKDARERPASARAVVDAIRDVERGLPAEDATLAYGGPVSPPRRPRWQVAVAAAAAALVLILAGVVVLRITRKDGKVEEIPVSEVEKIEFVNKDAPAETADAFEKRVKILPTEEQAKAVAARLKQLNPGFDGKVEHEVLHGEINKLTLRTDAIVDLTPVRALPRLRWLDCRGSALRSARLTDLTPLKGLPLTNLDICNTQVQDLTPLQDIPLTHLDCPGNRIESLAPLSGLKLRYLNCSSNNIRDLSPLRDMTSLQYLNCWRLPAVDLTPLRNLPLRAIRYNFRHERDAALLKSIKTLVEISGKPAAEALETPDFKP